MLLVRLLPQTISRHWEVIQLAISEAGMIGIDIDEEYLIAMANKLISGTVQCWASYEDSKWPHTIAALLFTSIVSDPIVGQKNLLIIGIYMFNLELLQGARVWSEGLEKLQLFAKANKCKRIVYYSNVPSLIALTKKLGATTEFTFGMWSVE